MQLVENNEDEKAIMDEPKVSLEISKDLNKLSGSIEHGHDMLQKQLQVLDYSELVYMNENSDYLHDYSLTTDVVIKYEKLHSQSIDVAHDMAQKVKASSEQLTDIKNNNSQLQEEY